LAESHHGSKAVHRAYARNANPDLLTIGAWQEQQAAKNVVEVEFAKPSQEKVVEVAINVRAPQEAFCMMASNVATGLEIERGDGGRAEALRPVPWSEWITLPIRDQDEAVQTVRGRIRVPTVIVAEPSSCPTVKLKSSCPYSPPPESRNRQPCTR